MEEARIRSAAEEIPHAANPFIGRETELAEIGRLLSNPDCRLLTLAGVGGAGKTRLALQVAGQVSSTYADGVFFVPLEAVSDPSLLLPAIVDALDLRLPDQQELEQQLLAYLRGRELLLILDSFEQLREAAGQLSTFVHAAPHLQLLVTSREALNLSDEWLFSVGGLRYPTGPEVSGLEEYDAVALFYSRARQIRPDFSPGEEAEGVLEICRHTEGIPLALELAASWVRTMRCKEIAAEIRQNVDFLASRLQDVPEQHRSMRAVFQQSSDRLHEEERAAFARLSVFRGGFEREAAAAVASASLETLSNLVDRSLLRWDPSGRYQIHELLRQYGTEELARSPAEAAGVQAQHGRYYTSYLEERTEALRGGRQREALTEIAAELENIRAAWEWALEKPQVDRLAAATEPLNQFYDFRGHYREGLRAFSREIEALSEVAPGESVRRGLALAHLYRGALYLRVGRLEDAQRDLERCQTLYDEMEMMPPPGYTSDPKILLGLLATIRGHFAEAARLGQETLEIAQASNHLLNRQFAHYLLARAALLQGDLEEARAQARQSYALTMTTRDRWFMAYCLNELGNVAFVQGEYDAARQHYSTSYKIRREFQDPEGMALALSHLGAIASREEKYKEADRLYRESLSISQSINNRGSATVALHGLARNALAQGDDDTARPLFQQAIQLIQEGQFASLFLSLLVDMATLLTRAGEQARAAGLLALVAGHPGSEPTARTQAREQLAQYGSGRIEKPQPAVAPDAGWPALERLLLELQAELQMAATPQVGDGPVDSTLSEAGAGVASEPAGTDLVESLTEREAEVLALIAEGLSNQEIAERLILALGTVKYYTSEIYGKLGVRNRVEAARRARELGLLR